MLSLCLVNDDPAQLMVQRRLLSRMATVQGYLSPLEALAAARQGQTSPYLITDFHMPGMDGPELATVWCELHPNARVLVISASEVTRQEQARVDGLPHGAVRLLTSYRITDLQDQATTWFGEDTGRQPGALEVSSSDARIDRQVLEKLGQLGGPEFVAKTTGRFLQSGPEKVRAIQAAFAVGDLTRVHELAHALKGSCGLVGAILLAATADRIEQATGDELTDNLEGLVRDMVSECEATVKELTEP